MIPDELNILSASYFETEDILALSEKMLGKLLISTKDQNLCISRIVEVEAYKAPEDKGSHAYGNRRTKRTEVIFGPPGKAYVYLCYGIHKMLNIISGRENLAHAILIRAVEPLEGIDTMLERRKVKNIHQLGSGPGKLCQALGIEMHHNGLDLCNKRSVLCIADAHCINEDEILRSPRVGISYAEECAHWPWRFRIKDNPFTSLPKNISYD